MSTCHPTHVQFTVLRARNLISKGKGGNNDVFVTIHLGKEKYQTSTIKNALHPEWFEECDLPIPFLQAEIEVTLYHRGVLSDDFLGYAAIPLWSNLNNSAPHAQGSQSQWVTLRGKPTAKAGSSSSLKTRGELEVKLTFHVKNQHDLSPHQGLKKQRPNSIRSFALAFGDKFKFSRSRSFRENRKDPEGGGKLDRSFAGGVDGTKNGIGPDDISRSFLNHHHQHHHHHQTQQQQQLQQRHHYVGRPPQPPPPPSPLPLPPVHFSALDINRIYWPIDEDTSDGLTRSYSLSAAYIKSMSLDRQAISLATNSRTTATTTASTANTTNTNNNRTNNTNSNSVNSRSRPDADGKTFHDSRGSGFVPTSHYHESGVSQLHSQSMYNLPGSRQSYGDLPLHRSSSSSTTTTTTAPPPYDPQTYPHHMMSKDDTDLYSIPRQHRRTASDYQISHGYNTNPNTNPNTNTNTNQNPPNPAGLFPENGSAIRDHSLPRPSQAVYESIKERTEPENSPSSSSLSSDDPESVPKPKTRAAKRFTRRDVPVMGSSGRDYAKISGLSVAPLSVNLNVTHSSSSSSRTLTHSAISSNMNSTTSTTSTIPPSSSSFIHQQQQQQQQQQLLQQSISSTFSTRDSGIVEDRSSSQTNSHDGGSFTTPDGTLSSAGVPSSSSTIHPLSSSHDPFHHQPSEYSHHHHLPHQPPPPPPPPPFNSSTNVAKTQRHSNSFENSANIARANSSGSIFYHVTSTRDIQFQGGPGGGLVAKEISSKKQVSAHQGHQLFGSREIGGGVGGIGGIPGPPEFVVRKRTRGQRDRLRQMRQDNRRVTVQGLANHHQASSGLYDDSLSEFSDSERNEVSENLVSAYKNMTKEELLRVAIQTKAQMIRKEKYIKDLENYIDDLLVRVMETTPRLLTRKGQHHAHRI